ncbi:MAG TPA: hypothetical protein VMZ28_25445 [Kofleriaceae bacterium]|nr:hypothetical protein [Kofleriaceae bacterium]
MRTLIVIAVCLLGLVATASAQPEPRGRERRAAAIRERIQLLRAQVLSHELTLDEGAAGRLSAVLDRYDATIDELHVRGARLRRELRRESAAEAGDEQALERRTDELLAHYEQLYRTQRERFAAARRTVSAAQGARLLLVLPRIDDEVRREIDRAVKHDRRRRGRMER